MHCSRLTNKNIVHILLLYLLANMTISISMDYCNPVRIHRMIINGYDYDYLMVFFTDLGV